MPPPMNASELLTQDLNLRRRSRRDAECRAKLREIFRRKAASVAAAHRRRKPGRRVLFPGVRQQSNLPSFEADLHSLSLHRRFVLSHGYFAATVEALRRSLLRGAWDDALHLTTVLCSMQRPPLYLLWEVRNLVCVWNTGVAAFNGKISDILASEPQDSLISVSCPPRVRTLLLKMLAFLRVMRSLPACRPFMLQLDFEITVCLVRLGDLRGAHDHVEAALTGGSHDFSVSSSSVAPGGLRDNGGNHDGADDGTHDGAASNLHGLSPSTAGNASMASFVSAATAAPMPSSGGSRNPLLLLMLGQLRIAIVEAAAADLGIAPTSSSELRTLIAQAHVALLEAESDSSVLPLAIPYHVRVYELMRSSSGQVDYLRRNAQWSPLALHLLGDLCRKLNRPSPVPLTNELLLSKFDYQCEHVNDWRQLINELLNPEFKEIFFHRLRQRKSWWFALHLSQHRYVKNKFVFAFKCLIALMVVPKQYAVLRDSLWFRRKLPRSMHGVIRRFKIPIDDFVPHASK